MTTPSTVMESLYATGLWLLDADRTSDAIHVFRAMLACGAEDERGWLALGVCHERSGEVATALALYHLGARATGGPRCHIARARVLRAEGETEAAEAALEEAATVAERNADEEIAMLISHERECA